MKIHMMEQRSDEWFAVRLGKITGTSFATVANGKKATVETLCEKTAAERITGLASESGYTNAAMERGIELEGQALELYATENFASVRRVGFVELDEFIGVSPDGLVDDNGTLEIKCPERHTHLAYLTGSKSWKTYRWKIQGDIFVTGRHWCDFVSYNPDFPPHLQLFIDRENVDAKNCDQLAAGMTHCRKRIQEILEKVNANVPS